MPRSLRARRLGALGVLSLLSLAACDTSASFTPDPNQPPPEHRADLPCGDEDPSHLCVALKYAPFRDPSGAAVVSAAQAKQNIVGVNSLWSQCQIQFFVEEYAPTDPHALGLSFNTSSMDELATIRQSVSESSTLLVATTGQWSGDLGSQSASAWTMLPPQGPFGVVLEQGVATNANLIAHELGHYLNLQHVTDQLDVMNPVVYKNSIGLDSGQCGQARATAISFWGQALR